MLLLLFVGELHAQIKNCHISATYNRGISFENLGSHSTAPVTANTVGFSDCVKLAKKRAQDICAVKVINAELSYMYAVEDIQIGRIESPIEFDCK